MPVRFDPFFFHALTPIMNAQPSPPPDRRPFQLMLIDEDAVFRSGLRLWLEQFPDICIVAEADEGTSALDRLSARVGVERTQPNGQRFDNRQLDLDLVMLDISLGEGDRGSMSGLDLCQQIRERYPNVPILLLSAFPEPVMVAAAQRAGANGYCPRTVDVEDLITIIRLVASGQSYWLQPIAAAPSDYGTQEPGATEIRVGKTTTPVTASPLQRPAPFAILRHNLRQSGLQQIDAALAEIAAQQRRLDLSDLDRAILAGRQRELRAARWIVNRLLATPRLGNGEGRGQKEQGTGQETVSVPPSLARPDRSPGSSPSSALVPQSPQPLDTRNVHNLQAILFDAVSAKLQGSLDNGTDIPLEIDILRPDKKRDLFYIVLRKLEELLDELRYSQVELDQLEPQRLLILQDLWQTSVIDFFGRYFMVQVENRNLEVVDFLLQDVGVVQAAILDRIPGIAELLKHLLFQVPLLVDGVAYPPGNPESLARAELLLENLLIQVANAVIQPLLNRFGNVETIKHSFYDRRLLSTREVERFRNDLSWRYRLQRYVREPKDIFESQYSLLVLSGRGIRKTSIYAPRNREMEQMTGIPFMITLALETRDAVSPRLRSVVSLVGNGLVYVLTEVIGRGIGLVGRGIIKGIGNVWQDGRFNRR